ncbi:MAG: cadmium-translocating P-type ATPase [Anaerolineaceae bacterium]|nr:cadmium-translocating P-type ATPase [Anaerolineaceae bacterium]
MSKSQKRRLRLILISAGLFVFALIFPFDKVFHGKAAKIIPAVIYLAAYLIIGWNVLYKAFRNIRNGQVFDENFLMAIATIGAIALQDYKEAVAVMLFYQIGELFEDYAVGKSRESISAMMDLRPDVANVLRDGEIEEVDPEEVEVNETILIKPGERVPLDGIVIEGESRLDTVALTGESVPQNIKPEENIYSGAVNLSGLLKVRVTKPYGESTVARILELVENASDKKSKSENFITKFAAVYTPVVVISALLLAIIPPLLFHEPWAVWINRALIFLVVSCPCALVISIPLSFFGGIGGASKKGILIKGSNFLETLANVRTIVFDKTGTLTNGTFTVTAVHPDLISESELLDYAAHAEAFSSHPIAQSIKEAYQKEPDLTRIRSNEEISGEGIISTVDGKKVIAGNMKLMNDRSINAHECHLNGTVVHVSIDGLYAGHIVISDTIKPDAKEAISGLKANGIRKTVMLTGDKKAVAADVSNQLGLDEFYAELLPQNKVEIVEKLISDNNENEKLAFVGDGINDAPVLIRADVGIAMGAMGADAAIEAADIVLMNDKPSDIVKAIEISKKTLRIVHENIIFAIGIKLLVLGLAAFGHATMWMAVFADVGVAFLAILNAMRCLK